MSLKANELLKKTDIVHKSYMDLFWAVFIKNASVLMGTSCMEKYENYFSFLFHGGKKIL